MKKIMVNAKRLLLMNAAALLGVVALSTVSTASAWYVYNGDVPDELLN
ncbi:MULTISPECIES: AgrD family cyclic lactone autoinducer peptide [unclassified Paenibacillus]|nr:cyclic lactone autoinducer peptide [Paenibacillus sp. FSL H8-0259]